MNVRLEVHFETVAMFHAILFIDRSHGFAISHRTKMAKQKHQEETKLLARNPPLVLVLLTGE
jgi:hypothetical protein